MKDICGTTGLACIKCNPGACDHRYYNAIEKMAATINKEANDLMLGTIKDIVTDAGIIHNYEINEKFVLMVVGKHTSKPIDNIIVEGDVFGTCPNCGRLLARYDFEDHNYCHSCGQRIDWGGGKAYEQEERKDRISEV